MEEWVLKSILSIGTQFKGAKEVVRQEQRVVSSNTNTNQPSNYTEHNSSANFERTNSNANSMDKTIMDEQLISEVQQHAIIYNRQKSSVFTGDKCVTKELAWQDVARNLTSDGESILYFQVFLSVYCFLEYLLQNFHVVHFFFQMNTHVKRFFFLFVLFSLINKSQIFHISFSGYV